MRSGELGLTLGNSDPTATTTTPTTLAAGGGGGGGGGGAYAPAADNGFTRALLDSGLLALTLTEEQAMDLTEEQVRHA